VDRAYDKVVEIENSLRAKKEIWEQAEWQYKIKDGNA
jgi:hypothetical protein